MLFQLLAAMGTAVERESHQDRHQKFEYGTNLPSLENFIALADHFGVSLDYLAGRSEEKEPRP